MALTGHGIGRLKKKLKPDSVYLSVVAFNSQNMQILLTTNGLLPTVTLAHGHREVRRCHFFSAAFARI